MFRWHMCPSKPLCLTFTTVLRPTLYHFLNDFFCLVGIWIVIMDFAYLDGEMGGCVHCNPLTFLQVECTKVRTASVALLTCVAFGFGSACQWHEAQEDWLQQNVALKLPWLPTFSCQLPVSFRHRPDAGTARPKLNHFFWLLLPNHILPHSFPLAMNGCSLTSLSLSFNQCRMRNANVSCMFR